MIKCTCCMRPTETFKRVSVLKTVNTFADDWIKCTDRMPAVETEVLVVHKGKIKIASLQWDIGGVEDTYQPYQYWADPDDFADYEWDDVTHWQPLSQPPQGV